MDFPVAYIDVAALRHNLSQVRAYAPDSKVMSVIKADAYGHGVREVAAALQGSDAFAVARLSEGIQLRQYGVTHPIVLLEGVNTAEDFIAAAEHDLSPLIHLQSQVDLLQTITLPKPLQFNWLMIDSGMHRLGIRPERALVALEALAACDNVQGEIGLMSHFANSDLVGDKRNQAQLTHMLSLKQQTGLPVCLSNSAAVVSLPESHLEWVRPGLMLYGISPFENRFAVALGLKPVMQLKTKLIAIYDLQVGEQVGYGGDWTASEPTKIGAASIGYGDGYSRHLSNKAPVLINGRLANVIGRVSMDTICIDLNDFDNVAVGDEVLLWGSESLPVEQLAQLAQTIPYELVTVICKRVQREYSRDT
ncbi:alanine racemase [Methylophaga sp. OBS4]|uniref:alanine racemase n=1 Tax=Methylophaga sp. OBS4 TaxID=2991935 RepID=UPI00225B62E2|nr:alanine racemase [Methylophaga sp. OBS4]MCX4187226.1 alanine racemase [Methylophaga sp. OBS4]